jgi:hypothetical protein
MQRDSASELGFGIPSRASDTARVAALPPALFPPSMSPPTSSRLLLVLFLTKKQRMTKLRVRVSSQDEFVNEKSKYKRGLGSNGEGITGGCVPEGPGVIPGVGKHSILIEFSVTSAVCMSGFRENVSVA